MSMNQPKSAYSEIYDAQCPIWRETAPAASPTALLNCIAQKLLTNPLLRSLASHGSKCCCAWSRGIHADFIVFAALRQLKN